MPVSQQGQGFYPAEICCTLAGMATIRANLNGEIIGQPVTLPIRASTATRLRLVEKGSLHCTAGLTLPTLDSAHGHDVNTEFVHVSSRQASSKSITIHSKLLVSTPPA